MSENKIETQATAEPVCPYCGTVEKNWLEYEGLAGDREEDIIECGNCGKEYHVKLLIRYFFNSKQKD